MLKRSVGVSAGGTGCIKPPHRAIPSAESSHIEDDAEKLSAGAVGAPLDCCIGSVVRCSSGAAARRDRLARSHDGGGNRVHARPEWRYARQLRRVSDLPSPACQRSRAGCRCMIAIAAAAAGSALLTDGRTAQAADAVRWCGSALSAQVSIEIYHPDRAEAERLVERCILDVRRLEQQFSLYLADPAISILNRTDISPDANMVALLKASLHFAALTDGAFDPTVQPLWQLYADHFSSERADPGGPSPLKLAEALSKVGHLGLLVNEDRIALNRHGAAPQGSVYAAVRSGDGPQPVARQHGERDGANRHRSGCAFDRVQPDAVAADPGCRRRPSERAGPHHRGRRNCNQKRRVRKAGVPAQDHRIRQAPRQMKKSAPKEANDNRRTSCEDLYLLGFWRW